MSSLLSSKLLKYLADCGAPELEAANAELLQLGKPLRRSPHSAPSRARTLAACLRVATSLFIELLWR